MGVVQLFIHFGAEKFGAVQKVLFLGNKTVSFELMIIRLNGCNFFFFEQQASGYNTLDFLNAKIKKARRKREELIFSCLRHKKELSSKGIDC